MARTVNPEEYASKRREILDAAQRLVFTKGYEQMTIRDILEEIQISSGAFHHYFDSREALLEAFIDRLQQEAEKPLLPILHDPQLTAIEKLQGFFDTLDSLRTAHRAAVIGFLRVWYTDDNAIVRLKVDEAVLRQRAPLLTEIVHQGIREGLFTTSFPDQSGEVILSLLQGMGNTHAGLLLAADRGKGAAGSSEIIERIVAIHAAYMDAIERVLGAPPNSLDRTDATAAKTWVDAVQGSDQV
jgi:AcrR family transcriptional regulator